MTAMAATAGEFSIGRVVSRTFSSLGANLVSLLIIAVVLVAVPAAALAWIQTTFLSSGGFAAAGLGTVMTNSLAGLVLGLLRIALGAAARGAIFYIVFRELSGRKASLGEALSSGLAHWWPLWLVSICVSFMTVIASMALLVPGIMVAIRWCVAMPAQVLENKGVFESMGRSADLTKGRRWSIFGLFLVVGLAILIIEFVLMAVFVRPTAGFIAGLSAPLTQIIVTPILAVLTTPLFSAGVASLYYELRSTRDGVGVEALASVFD